MSTECSQKPRTGSSRSVVNRWTWLRPSHLDLGYPQNLQISATDLKCKRRHSALLNVRQIYSQYSRKKELRCQHQGRFMMHAPYACLFAKELPKLACGFAMTPVKVLTLTAVNTSSLIPPPSPASQSTYQATEHDYTQNHNNPRVKACLNNLC